MRILRFLIVEATTAACMDACTLEVFGQLSQTAPGVLEAIDP
ncbi:hypothetical protein QT971_29150 [Microcoleus sp. herbarium19]